MFRSSHIRSSEGMSGSHAVRSSALHTKRALSRCCAHHDLPTITRLLSRSLSISIHAKRTQSGLAGGQLKPLAKPVPADAFVTASSSPSTIDNSASTADDTIFALSTAPGRAGVAIIRISGPQASEALRLMAPSDKKDEVAPRKATVRKIIHPKTKELLDRALVLYFKAPASFTGEDVVELHVHGGAAVVRDILAALDGLPQYRIADRGEFAQRAFHNDKLDLTEIEGLADLINAETEMQRRIALQQAGVLFHFLVSIAVFAD